MNVNKSATPPLAPELIEQFRKIVGDKHAITDATDIQAYVTEERNLFHGRSPLVLRPGSTAEVSAICKLASAHRIALVPQGGNTGLVGGQTPHNGEVVVSLRRLDKIREVDTASNTMTCEAGVVLQVAQQKAADVDRLFPISLGDDARTPLETILTRAMEDEIVDDAVIAANLTQRNGFWKLREEMSSAQKPEGGSIKHDISVPVAAVPAFIDEANAAVAKLIPGARPVPFGHLGDGNLHYNVSEPIGANTADYLARWHEMNAVVFEIVLRMGGSISAEHGIGVLKRDELPEVKDKTAIELMRAIKAMLDPQGIMNPGKVL
jgi:FAD/FMN-containing dehydrogenase